MVHLGRHSGNNVVYQNIAPDIHSQGKLYRQERFQACQNTTLHLPNKLSSDQMWFQDVFLEYRLTPYAKGARNNPNHLLWPLTNANSSWHTLHVLH